MVTWRTGVEAIHDALLQEPEAVSGSCPNYRRTRFPASRAPRYFLTRSNQKVSRLIVDHAHYTGVLPTRTIALSMRFENTPRIVGPKCAVVEKIGEGLWLVVARFGFFEIPDLRAAAQ